VTFVFHSERNGCLPFAGPLLGFDSASVIWIRAGLHGTQRRSRSLGATWASAFTPWAMNL